MCYLMNLKLYVCYMFLFKTFVKVLHLCISGMISWLVLGTEAGFTSRRNWLLRTMTRAENSWWAQSKLQCFSLYAYISCHSCAESTNYEPVYNRLFSIIPWHYFINMAVKVKWKCRFLNVFIYIFLTFFNDTSAHGICKHVHPKHHEVK